MPRLTRTLTLLLTLSLFLAACVPIAIVPPTSTPFPSASATRPADVYYLTLTATLSITPPTRVPSRGTITPIPTRPTATSTPTRNPRILQLSWADGAYDYQPILVDARRLNLPLTPLPEDRPAANFIPTARAPGVDFLDATASLDAIALEIARQFASHQPEGSAWLEETLRSQNLLCKKMSIIEHANRFRMEYLLPLRFSIPLQPSEGDADVCMNIVYLMSCQSNPPYCGIARLGEPDERFQSVLNIQDINRDAIDELFVGNHQCGASDCFDRLHVVALNGGVDGWYSYLASIDVHNGSIVAADENSDGIYEIYARDSDFPGYLGGLYDNKGNPLFGPLNSHLLIYEWNGTQYALSGHAYTHECLFHLIWDGVDWAKQGYFATALSVFEIARKADLSEECSYDNIPHPWKVYVEFALGMLHARLGHEQEAIEFLTQAKSLEEEKIYTPLIDIFLAAYPQGYQAACQALDSYTANLSDKTYQGPYAARAVTTFCTGDLGQ